MTQTPILRVEAADAVAISIDTAARLRDQTTKEHKATWGQFFTPRAIAEFMAGWIDASAAPVRILDLGAGAGVLGISAAKAALCSGAPSVHLVAVEREARAAAGLRLALDAARKVWGARLVCELVEEDALELATPRLGSALFAPFDVVISNPPYFKMSPKDVRGGDAPNAYARFMEVGASLVRTGGQLVYITPRSFASGLYFKRFRRRFHAQMTLERVHVFDSRKDAFKCHDVLQENVIVAYRKGPSASRKVTLTSSHGVRDLDRAHFYSARRDTLISPRDPECVLFLPASADDISTMRTVFAWPSCLRALGLKVSTGPVVPFRTDRMRDEASATTVPLLWLQHVVDGGISWPLPGGFRKPEYIEGDVGDKLLVPNQTYILLRRFSAKEDPRRLMLGVLREGELPGEAIGLENHINYIHRPGGQFDEVLAIGLAAVLSSNVVDEFFRIQSGNTQVSATELRSLPLPNEPALRAIGAALLSRGPRALAEGE